MEKVTMESYWQRRVQRGAMWLDMTIPGWASKINRGIFDMDIGCNCIVGQLMGPYYSFLKKFLPAGGVARDFGVSPYPEHSREEEQYKPLTFCRGVARAWELLDDLWLAEIEERLLLPAPEPATESSHQRRARLLRRDRLAETLC